MGVALFLIGILAILAGIVMFIIALVRKKGWGIVRSSVIGGVGLILTIVGMIVGITQEATKPQPLPPPASAPRPTTAPAPTSIPIIYSINQNVEVGTARYLVLSALDRGNILKSSDSKFPFINKDKATNGRFIEIGLEIENTGTITETFVAPPILIDGQNREFKEMGLDVFEWIPEGKIFSGELHPSVPRQFILMYEVAKDATELKLKVRDISFWGTKHALIDLGL